MKKIILSMIVFMVLTPVSFAKGSKFLERTETSVFSGKVDSVYIGDTEKGEKKEIFVVADNGKVRGFNVAGDTAIYDKDGKTITLNKIAKNSKVVVEYVTLKKGKISVTSIKVKK